MRTSPFTNFLLASLFAYCISLQARAESPIWVGVFEDLEQEDVFTKQRTIPQVRLAFNYHDGAWHSFNNEYPPTVDWTVVFDGRRIGTLQSRAPKLPVEKPYYTGVENITTPLEKLPHIHTGADQFTYAANASHDRPLLLVSQPHFTDPDGWKRTSLSATEKQLALQNFRTKVPSLEQCDSAEQVTPTSLIPYTENQVIFLNTYRSKQGEVLVGMQLNSGQTVCDFSDDDPMFHDYWFVLNSTSARFLDSQMTPMDAADFTSTGHSAWMFMTSKTSKGAGKNGYELFYDDFAKSISFNWTDN